MRTNSIGPREKREVLRSSLRDAGRLVVAYSGGVDSAYLSAEASDVLGADALVVTAVSPSLASAERGAAASLANERGWNHREVTTAEGERPEYVRNSSDRCYWCKTELFEVLVPIAKELGARVAVGTNLDDLGDHRPGIDAASERDILTPLADAGLTKAEVRSLSRELGLPTADKPASPCLASRLAYGVEVTPERLARVDAAESFLRELGLEVLRVRDHGDLARIEVPRELIEQVAATAERIEARLKELGFRYVTLDLGGFVSGSLNSVLGASELRIRR